MRLLAALPLLTLSLAAQTHGILYPEPCVAKHQDRVSVCVYKSPGPAWTAEMAVAVEVTRFSHTTEVLTVRLHYLDVDGIKRTAVQVLDVVPTARDVQIGFRPQPLAMFRITGTQPSVSVEESQRPREFEP